MTKLVEEIKQKLKTASKERNKIAVSTYRMILAAIQRKEQDTKDAAIKAKKQYSPISEQETLKIVEKFNKDLKEEISAFTKVNNQTKVSELNLSLQYAKQFLPEQLTEADILPLITAAIESIEGTPKIGSVLKIVRPKVEGRYDSKALSVLVGDILKQIEEYTVQHI